MLCKINGGLTIKQNKHVLKVHRSKWGTAKLIWMYNGDLL